MPEPSIFIWRSRPFLLQLLLSVLLVVGAILALASYLQFNEGRAGVTLDDPLLKLLPTYDLSWITFALIYLSTLLALLGLLRHPHALLVALRAYALVVVVRIVAMYVIPLDVPAGLVPLSDPLASVVGVGPDIRRDLFFSGHTATVFLFYLCSVDRRVRLVLLIATVAIGLCVLLQHVHYTIDVLAAPFFAYGCYRAALLLSTKDRNAQGLT